MLHDDIRVFLQVVKSGSLTRASKLAFRPKASLSHHLKRLEQELGTQLFDRRLGRMVLNDAGREFLPHAQTIHAACMSGRDAARTGAGIGADAISIATSVEFASNIVSSIFLDFADAEPAISVSAMSFPRDVLPEICDLFDCTLFLGEPVSAAFQNMQARKLGTLRYALYASSAYLDQHGVPNTPQDLSDHLLLVRREHSEPQAWTLQRGAQSMVVDPSARLMSNDPWIIKIAAVRGQGICFLPDFFMALEMEEGLVLNVLPDWRSEEIPLNALYSSHRAGNAQLGAMLDFAAENFSKIDQYLYRVTR